MVHVRAEMIRRLVACRRGGTDFVQVLIGLALIAFVVLGGVRLFGDSVRAKFVDESSQLWAMEGSASAHSGSPPAGGHTPSTAGGGTHPGSGSVHTPGTTTPGEAPTETPGTAEAPAPGGAEGESNPWPSWLEPIVRYGPAVGVASPAMVGPLIHDYYEVHVSPFLSVGAKVEGAGANVLIDPSNPEVPPIKRVEIEATAPRTWAAGALAAETVWNGNVDNTMVIVAAPIPSGMAKKLLRKVLAEASVAKLVKAFPELEGEIGSGIEEGVRMLEVGAKGGFGTEGFKVKVGANVFAGANGEWGVKVSLGLVQFGHITQSMGIKVTAEPREEPLHEGWLRNAINRYQSGGLTGLILGADSAPDYAQAGAIDVIHPDGTVEKDVPLAKVLKRVERGELSAGGVNGALNSRDAARGNLSVRAQRTGKSQVLIYYPQGINLAEGADRRKIVGDRVHAISEAAASSGFSWSCHSHACHVVLPQIANAPNQALEAYAPTELPGKQANTWEHALEGANINVTIIRGDRDEISSVLGADDSHTIAINPHVREVIVPGAGHHYVDLVR